jgi:6-phosphogluconolactonase
VQIDKLKTTAWDERRHLVIPGDYNTTLIFCLEHFISVAKESIADHAQFFVALSGGSTPKILFEHLCQPPYQQQLDWSKIFLFWSDERSVPPDHPDSNYHMAMEAGFQAMSIPKEQIHRMQAEESIEENSLLYEKTIHTVLKGRPFDLVMLGMGDDGHTASLFPHTEGLKSQARWVVANYVPEKKTWRMTLTFECINQARHIAIYVLGACKKHILEKVLKSPPQFDLFPVQKVGTREHPALWIADEAAAALLT